MKKLMLLVAFALSLSVASSALADPPTPDCQTLGTCPGGNNGGN